MSKITYLNSHLQKYRKEPEFRIDLEDVEALAYYDILVKEDKKTTKIFVKCFKNKKTYKDLLNKLPNNVDRLGKFYLITAYWLCFINYYYYDTFGDEINKCLENTEQEQVLLKSPHFCKKVYHYLMKPEII
jgi:hypothetical protein